MKEHTVSTSSDTQCASTVPGHKIQWTTGASSSAVESWVDAQVHVDADLDLIQLIVNGEQQLMWFHDLPTLALALSGTQGTPQWCAHYGALLVPGGFDGPAGRSFFSLATPERVRACEPVRTAAGVAAAPPLLR